MSVNIKITAGLIIFFIIFFRCSKPDEGKIINDSENSLKDTLIISEATEYSEFKFCIYKKENDILLFRLLYPLNYDSSKNYPLVIFLHGAGERGNDNESQLSFAGKVFSDEKFMKKYPSFVLIPQCPEEYRWVEVDWGLEDHIMPESPSKPFSLLIPMIDKIILSYNIDTNRLYLMGLSMGGFGVWDLISRYPEKFAAAVPICGGGDEQQAEKLTGIPIWAFHGKLDKVVLPSRSVNMIDAVRKAGGNPKFTLYPDVGHGSWHNAFSEPELFPWLFGQKLK